MYTPVSEAPSYAALMSKELPKRENDISTLSERDVAPPKELVAVLTPLKIATIALCEENVLALSMILPLQYLMKEKDEDTALLKQVKHTHCMLNLE